MIQRGHFARRTQCITGFIAVFAVWSPGAARAAGPAAPSTLSNADLAAAKQHYADGEKKFKSGDYSQALEDFHSAEDIKPTPQAERYIGLAEDALGHYSAAVDWYAKFLAAVPPKMSAAGDETRRRMAQIWAMPGKVHIESNPPGADVFVDGNEQPSPTPVDVDLAPGRHALELKETGRLPAERTLDVAFASSQNVAVDLDPESAPLPAPPPPPLAVAPAPPAPSPPSVPPPQEPRSKVPAYVTGALAIAAAGVGTVFGVLALDDKAEFDRNPTTQTADNGDTHSLIADMSFGIAITFAVTSIVLFATKDEGRASTTSASPQVRTAGSTPAGKKGVEWSAAPLVGSRSGGAALSVRF